MLLAIISLAAGLALLIGAGELLVRGAVRLADGLGVSPLIVGLVVVGSGTSAPELVASLEATRIGAPGLAWGNIIGSNFANSMLILGVAAAIAPVGVARKPLWRDGGFGLAALLAFWAAAALGLLDLTAGLVMLGLLTAYFIYAWMTERSAGQGATALGEHAAAREIADPEIHLAALKKPWNHPLVRAGALFLAGLGGIIIGGRLLIDGAVEIAAWLGMSDALIGLTIVAIGTSMPELVTSAIAAWRGSSGVALGNVLGSNIYNLLGIGGAVAIASPDSFPAPMLAFDLPVLAAASLVLMLFAYSGFRIGRREGWIMIAIYAVVLGINVWHGIA